MNFLTNKENQLSKKFIKQGYIISKVEKKKSLEYILNLTKKSIYKIIKKKIHNLNTLHNYVDVKDLNDLRVELIHNINKDQKFRFHYFSLTSGLINTLVGNELMMQNKINLSIQFPNDDSSLLPIHSDVWSGDSPYEINLWVPLVNCYKTKSMYILKGSHRNNYFNLKTKKKFSNNSSEIYKLLKKKLIWLKVNKGQTLLFDQTLPHGNIINQERETRVTMNCRFKSIFSPYADKKIGEYFTPITMRAMTDIGNNFNYPF